MGLKDNLKTPLGRLQWMLEIIKASLDKRPRDDVLILDCLFALMYVGRGVVVCKSGCGWLT